MTDQNEETPDRARALKLHREHLKEDYVNQRQDRLVDDLHRAIEFQEQRQPAAGQTVNNAAKPTAWRGEKAARERERIIRDAARAKEAVLNRDVLSRSRSVGQQKALEIRAVEEKRDADLRDLGEREAQRKEQQFDPIRQLLQTKQQFAIDQHFARLERQGQTGSAARPIVWDGEKWQFVDAVLSFRERGFIKAESETDAVRQVAAHFCDRNGKPFDVRSILQSYKHKKNPD
jgi:hypothetical protein